MLDPRSKYPKPPFKRQTQHWPGLARDMEPKPDHGEASYRGSVPAPIEMATLRRLNWPPDADVLATLRRLIWPPEADVLATSRTGERRC